MRETSSFMTYSNVQKGWICRTHRRSARRDCSLQGLARDVGYRSDQNGGFVLSGKQTGRVLTKSAVHSVKRRNNVNKHREMLYRMMSGVAGGGFLLRFYSTYLQTKHHDRFG